MRAQQLHEGVKKSGIMGFCDPCPGEAKHLLVEYTYRGNVYEVPNCLLCHIYPEYNRYPSDRKLSSLLKPG